MMRVVVMGWLVMALSACPGKPECSSAGDCEPLVPNAASSAPSQANKYCEGGACVSPPSGTSALTIDLRTPRNVAVQSIRYAVIDFKGANVVSECKGKANCPAEAVTCDDIKNDGLEAAHFNVALGGAKNTDTQNGTITQFNGLALGNVPVASQNLAIEGRSGTLGSGDRVAWSCTVVVPSGGTTSETITLLAN